MISWAFSQGCSDLQTQKETWASTEADVITNELTNAGKNSSKCSGTFILTLF